MNHVATAWNLYTAKFMCNLIPWIRNTKKQAAKSNIQPTAQELSPLQRWVATSKFVYLFNLFCCQVVIWQPNGDHFIRYLGMTRVVKLNFHVMCHVQVEKFPKLQFLEFAKLWSKNFANQTPRSRCTRDIPFTTNQCTLCCPLKTFQVPPGEGQWSFKFALLLVTD